MKNRILTLMLVSFFSVIAVNGQNVVKNNPVGIWKFEAAYAPEGYTSGTIVVSLAEQKYSTTMSFTGSEYVLPGEKVKELNDSVLFSIYLEGQDIKVKLKMVNDTNMTGKAVYSEGEVPLILTKVLASEQETKQ